METSVAGAASETQRPSFEGLEFPVSKFPLGHPFPKTENEMIKGRQAIIRTDTREVLNIVSDRYPLVPHLEVFGAMEEAIKQIGVPILGRKVRSANSGAYGKVVWTLDQKMFIDDNRMEDAINITIHARNSYNYSSLVGLELGAIRYICTNGMMVGRILSRARKRHVPSIKVPALVGQISAILEQTEKVRNRWSQWNQIEYSRDRFAEWLSTQPLGKAGRQEVLDYYTIQPDRVRAGDGPLYTGWEAFNALTWFGTHRATSRKEDTRLLAEERVLELAQAFSREELETQISKRTN